MTLLQDHKTLISCHCHITLRVVISWRWRFQEDMQCQQSETLVLRKVWVDAGVQECLKRHQLQRNTLLLLFYHWNVWLCWRRDEKLCYFILCDCHPPHNASTLTGWYIVSFCPGLDHEPKCHICFMNCSVRVMNNEQLGWLMQLRGWRASSWFAHGELLGKVCLETVALPLTHMVLIPLSLFLSEVKFSGFLLSFHPNNILTQVLSISDRPEVPKLNNCEIYTIGSQSQTFLIWDCEFLKYHKLSRHYASQYLHERSPEKQEAN